MLFTPHTLGRKKLKNRIIYPAVLSIYAQQNRVTDRLITYYEERARGGAAMLITEGMAIHPSSVPQPGVVCIFDPDNFAGLQKMAAAVESHDCRLVGQLWHVGRQALWNPVDAPMGVSSLPDAYSWSVPHVMNEDDIREVIAAYVHCAQILQRAGFSGVELHGAHGYLITQFLSPWSNTRTDAYGGDLERRTRFVRDIVSGIRQACGDDFIVGLKMSGDEGVKGGIDEQEAGRIAERLAQAGGLDYLGFGQGNFSPSLEDHTPDMNYAAGPFMDLQSRLRPHAKPISVVAFGRVLDVDHAEQLLKDGVADLIGMGRALVSDPALPNKAQRGQKDQIRPCVFCNVCWAEIHAGKPMACIHNPELARPGEADWTPPAAERQRHVVVVGSGVAGMEAAWVAAARGHQVTWVGSSTPGGKTRLEAGLPGRAELDKVMQFQLARIREHGVKMLVNQKASVADIQALKPDAVVLATGSRMRATALAAGSQPSIDARDWLAANLSAPVGEKQAGTVVLFDQDHGAGTYALADLLAKRYSKLVVLTPRTQLGRAIAYVNLIGVYRRLHQARAEIVGAALPQRWSSRQLTYVNAFNGDETVIDHVDLFLHATPREAQDELAAGLRSHGLEVHVVGDAYAPRTLLAAIHEGHRAGLNV
jgi:2,4-dienoyl-CoA reductase-like NADH-dependent reductase (Old Yellow Enzyme family)